MCYSELGVNLPSSGGEYVYLTEAFGPTWGFMTGWVSFFAGFSAPIAVAALAFADYVGYFFPESCPENARAIAGSRRLDLPAGRRTSGWPAFWSRCLHVLNVVGVQRAARVQNVLTAAESGGHRQLHRVRIPGRPRRSRATFRAPRFATSANPLPEQFAISLFLVLLCL